MLDWAEILYLSAIWVRRGREIVENYSEGQIHDGGLTAHKLEMIQSL